MSISTIGRAQARSGMLFVLSSAILWGTVGVTTKALYGLSATTPLSIGFFRLGIASPILLAVGWRALKWRLFKIPARDLGLMALIGILMGYYQVSFFTAVQSLGAAVATLITLCTAPAMVAILSTLLTKERLTAKILASMVFALLGTTLLIQVRPESAFSGSGLSGVAWALSSALGYSGMLIISRDLAGRYHPVQPYAIGLGLGALLLFGVAQAGGGLVLSYPPAGWALLCYLAVVPTALAFGLFITGMQHTPATVASIITLLEPLTSTILAWLFFKEQLGPLGAAGAALLCGAMLLLWRR